MPFSFIVIILSLVLFYILMKSIYRDYLRKGLITEAVEDKKDEIVKKQIKKIKEKN